MIFNLLYFIYFDQIFFIVMIYLYIYNDFLNKIDKIDDLYMNNNI